MNNYLSHRWPEGPVTPIVPPQKSKPPKKRRLARFFLILGCIVGVAALVVGAYFGIIYLAERFASNAHPGPTPSASQPGTPHSTPGSQWLPDDLDWAVPDPSTEIALSQPVADTLTPQKIYDRVIPSVVCVTAVQPGTGVYSVGSGVVLTRSGYIVTNYHVIDGGTELSVMRLPDETSFDAKLVGYDEELDLAVLKTDAPDLTPASLTDSDLLDVGDTVYAIGNPMGYLYGSMTDGIVSSLARQIDFGDRTMTLIQTSVPLNSGNSGGALIDTHGQVAGIAVAKITGIHGDTVVEGIGLAIPITDALPFINHIIHTGTSCRPSLGIMCYETRLDDQRGILVDETTPDTPAAQLLKKDDFIIAANGKSVSRLYDLTRILYATGVGNRVELTVIRDQAEITVSITLYDRLAQ